MFDIVAPCTNQKQASAYEWYCLEAQIVKKWLWITSPQTQLVAFSLRQTPGRKRKGRATNMNSSRTEILLTSKTQDVTAITAPTPIAVLSLTWNTYLRIIKLYLCIRNIIPKKSKQTNKQKHTENPQHE